MGWEDSHIGSRYSYQFNGIDYFETPADSSLDLTGDFSYGFMIRPGRADSAIASRQIVGTVAPDGTNTAFIIDSKQHYLRVSLFDANGTNQLTVLTLMPVLKTKRIVDIEVTWDYQNRHLLIYKNGTTVPYEIVHTTTPPYYLHLSDLGLMPALSSSVMYFGYASSGFNVFDGKLYDLRYLDKVRTSEEIKQYFSNIKPPAQYGAVGKILFSSKRMQTTPNPFNLYTMDSLGNNQKPFYISSDDSIHPKWSLDGQHAAFAKFIQGHDSSSSADNTVPGIYTINRKGGELHLIRESEPVPQGTFSSTPSWGVQGGSPSLVYISRASPDGGYNWGSRLYRSDNPLSSAPASTVFDSGGDTNYNILYDCSNVSSDNTFVVFNKAYPNYYYYSEIVKQYTDPLTGIAQQKYVLSSGTYFHLNVKLSPNDAYIAWSQSGVAFYSYGDYTLHLGVYQVWIMNSDGGNPTQITNMPSDCNVRCFSPDSQKILFSMQVSGLEQLFTMDIDGSNIRNISNGRYNDSYADWRDLLSGEEDEEINSPLGDV